MLLSGSCSGGGVEEESSKIEVRNEQGIIVLKGFIVDETKMDGECSWFNGKGQKVTQGTFKDGEPWEGTFLDWSLFIDNWKGNNPFEATEYAKDWVTIYEASFLSRKIDYSPVIVSYKNGKRLD